MDKPKSYNYVERIAVKVEIDALSKQIDDLNLRIGELSAKVRTMRDDWQITPADQWMDTRWIRLAVEVLAGIDHSQEQRIYQASGITYGPGGVDYLIVNLKNVLKGMIALREAEEKK